MKIIYLSYHNYYKALELSGFLTVYDRRGVIAQSR